MTRLLESPRYGENQARLWLAVEAAHAFADRVRREAGEDPARQIRLAFRLALLRSASPEEIRRSGVLLQQHGLTAPCRALLNLNEFAYVD